MKTHKERKIITGIAVAIFLLGGTMTYAQEPIGNLRGPGPVISAPGSQLNNGPAPAPGSDVYNPGPQVAPPPPLANPGAPGPMAPMVTDAPLSTPNWQNAGTITVIACGYDAQSVWQTIPLRVTYTYNGAQYEVMVDSAYNPWTQTWNYGVDQPAFNTYYFLNGNYYNFYTNLSTGTYYFNL